VAVRVPKRATLRRGLKVAVTAPSAGRVTGKLRRGATVVAAGRATAAAAGELKLKLELRRGIRPRTLRGRSLTLRVVWSDDDGASSTATAKLRAR